jgi:hypothetical protein
LAPGPLLNLTDGPRALNAAQSIRDKLRGPKSADHAAKLRAILTPARTSRLKADQKARGRFLGGDVPSGFEVGADGALVAIDAQQGAIGEIAALKGAIAEGHSRRDASEGASRSVTRAWRASSRAGGPRNLSGDSPLRGVNDNSRDPREGEILLVIADQERQPIGKDVI